MLWRGSYASTLQSAKNRPFQETASIPCKFGMAEGARPGKRCSDVMMLSPLGEPERGRVEGDGTGADVGKAPCVLIPPPANPEQGIRQKSPGGCITVIIPLTTQKFR